MVIQNWVNIGSDDDDEKEDGNDEDKEEDNEEDSNQLQNLSSKLPIWNFIQISQGSLC